jgi:hypothetical protein
VARVRPAIVDIEPILPTSEQRAQDLVERVTPEPFIPSAIDAHNNVLRFETPQLVSVHPSADLG